MDFQVIDCIGSSLGLFLFQMAVSIYLQCVDTVVNNRYRTPRLTKISAVIF